MTGSVSLTSMKDMDDDFSFEGSAINSSEEGNEKKRELYLLNNIGDKLELKLEGLRDEIGEMNKIKHSNEQQMISEIRKLGKMKKDLTNEIKKYYKAVKLLRGEKIDIENKITEFGSMEMNQLEEAISETIIDVDTESVKLQIKAKRLLDREVKVSNTEQLQEEVRLDLLKKSDSIASKTSYLKTTEQYLKETASELDKREIKVGEEVFEARTKLKTLNDKIEKKEDVFKEQIKKIAGWADEYELKGKQLKTKEILLTAKEKTLSQKEDIMNKKELDLRNKENNLKRTARSLRKQHGR